jgi:hypothetical protein
MKTQIDNLYSLCRDLTNALHKCGIDRIDRCGVMATKDGWVLLQFGHNEFEVNIQFGSIEFKHYATEHDLNIMFENFKHLPAEIIAEYEANESEHLYQKLSYHENEATRIKNIIESKS